MLAIIALGTMVISRADTLDAETLLTGFDESDEQLAEMVERMEELRRRPLNLNRCSADDLLELPFVSAAEAHAVVHHRQKNGPFKAEGTLRVVDGLDAATAERMLPFVVAGPPPGAQARLRFRSEFIQRWTRRLELAQGFRSDSSGYLGGPNVLQTRVNVSLGKLSARATFDKDAGEPMRWNDRTRSLGYDFMAGHIQVERIGWLRRIVLGDYSPRFAHGVLVRAPGTVRTAVPAGRGGASSLRPYASASETGFFRGVGIEVAPAEWMALTVFASKRKIDAGIDTTAAGEFPAVSRRTSGLHRTFTERAGRDALEESSIGGALRSTFGPFSIAAAFIASDEAVRMPFVRRRVVNYSVSAGASFGTMYVATELAPGAGLSAVVEIRPGSQNRIEVALRRAFGSSYLPTSTLAGGSDGMTDAATGIAVRGRHRLSQRTRLEFVLEHALQQDLPDRRPFATIRSRADVLLSHSPMPWLTLTFRGSERRSDEVGVCHGGTVRCLLPAARRTFRLQLDYAHSRVVQCRLRGEYVRADENLGPQIETSHGVLLYEELRIRPNDALQLIARLAIFSADAHPARIYTYENDLTYAFASPSFTGRGRRAFILVRWKTANAFTLEAKWSQTVQADATSIGSGRDQIDGGRLREVRIQFRLRF